MPNGLALHAGTILKGLFVQQGRKEAYPMEMVVESSNGGIITGYLKWLSMNGKTKFKGTIKEDSAYFSEYEVIEGTNIGVPNIYEGKIVANSISGVCKHANEIGTFHVEIAD